MSSYEHPALDTEYYQELKDDLERDVCQVRSATGKKRYARINDARTCYEMVTLNDLKGSTEWGRRIVVEDGKKVVKPVPKGERFGDDLRYQYLMNYVAHMFHNPGKRQRTMLIFKSKAEGVGKTQFTDFLGEMLEPDVLYQAEAEVDKVVGRLSVTTRHKLLVVLNDAKSSDVAASKDKLMSLVTDRKSTTRGPYQQASHDDNYCRFIWTTTREMLPVRPTENRRLVVFECDDTLAEEGDSYHTGIYDMYHDPLVQRSFYQSLVWRSEEEVDWLDRPYSSCLERWTAAAKLQGPSSGVSGQRLLDLHGHIVAFTVMLARTHDEYANAATAKRDKATKEQIGPDGVWEHFVAYMEDDARQTAWEKANKPRPYSAIQFGKDITDARVNIFGAWSKKRSNHHQLYTLDVAKVEAQMGASSQKRPRFGDGDDGGASGDAASQSEAEDDNAANQSEADDDNAANQSEAEEDDASSQSEEDKDAAAKQDDDDAASSET